MKNPNNPKRSATNLTPKLQRPLADAPPARIAQDVQEPVKSAPKKPEVLKSVKPVAAPLAQDSAPKKAPSTTDIAKKAPTPSVSPQNQDSTKKSPASPATAKSAVPSSYLVQAGTFSDESNAKNLVDKLKKRSLPVRLQVVEGLNGKVYRVTVGPNLDRARAEQIQKQLSEQDGVRGLILQSH
jgi:DedD protein